MELSVSAKKIITNAQAFRVENDHNSLCVEHLLYGVLLLGKENSYDGSKVRSFLEKEMQNPDAALTQLKADAKQDSSFFKDAAPVLGRATELAGGGEIGAMTLAQAESFVSFVSHLSHHCSFRLSWHSYITFSRGGR